MAELAVAASFAVALVIGVVLAVVGISLWWLMRR